LIIFPPILDLVDDDLRECALLSSQDREECRRFLVETADIFREGRVINEKVVLCATLQGGTCSHGSRLVVTLYLDDDNPSMASGNCSLVGLVSTIHVDADSGQLFLQGPAVSDPIDTKFGLIFEGKRGVGMFGNFWEGPDNSGLEKPDGDVEEGSEVFWTRVEECSGGDNNDGGIRNLHGRLMS
jgi:hypothetical protein